MSTAIEEIRSASVELRSACATNLPPVNCSQTSRVQKPRFFVCDIERGAADAAVEGEGRGREGEGDGEGLMLMLVGL